MPHTLTYSLRGVTTISASNPPGTLKWYEEFGKGNAPPGCATWANGTGNGCANQTYVGNGTGADEGSITLAAGATLVVSLKGANGELDARNKPLSLSTVVAFYLELATPGPGNGIKVGPQGNGCMANLGWGNTSNETLMGPTLKSAENGNGWPVSAAAGNISFTNTSATTQKFWPRISGVAA